MTTTRILGPGVATVLDDVTQDDFDHDTMPVLVNLCLSGEGPRGGLC
jgi:hypothetical protein